MLIILRAVFMLALGVVAITFITGEDAASGTILWFTRYPDLLLISCMGIAMIVIAIDIFIPQKSLTAISGVFFGIVVGMVFAFGLSMIVDLLVGSLTRTFPPLRTPIFADIPVPTMTKQNRVEMVIERQQIGYSDHPFVSTVKLSIGVICCYLTVSFIHTKRVP